VNEEIFLVESELEHLSRHHQDDRQQRELR